MRFWDFISALIAVAVSAEATVLFMSPTTELPPLLTLALQAGAAGLALVWFAPARGRTVAIALLIAIFAVTGGTLALRHAAPLLPAPTALLLAAAAVPLGIFLAALFLREKFGWARAAGLILAFAGLAVLAGGPSAPADWRPALILLGAAFAWACAMVLTRSTLDTSAAALIAWIALFSAVLVGIASYVLESGQIESVQSLRPPEWIPILALAVGGTMVGGGLWCRLFQLYPVNQVAPFFLAVPAALGLIEFAWHGAALDLFFFGGATLILVGLILSAATGPAPSMTPLVVRHPMSADDAHAIAMAYRDERRTGGDQRAALNAAVMVYRIRYPEIPEPEARSFVVGMLSKAVTN